MATDRYYVRAEGRYSAVRHYAVIDREDEVPFPVTLDEQGRVFFGRELAEAKAAELNLAHEMAEARAEVEAHGYRS